MKKFFYSLFLNIVIFIAVASGFEGLSFPKDFMYGVVTLLALSFGVMLYRPILKFLTVKVNFLTYFITAFLLISGVMYGLELFIPELYINSSSFKEVNLQLITINAFTVSQVGTLLGFSMVSAFISGMLDSLRKSSDD